MSQLLDKSLLDRISAEAGKSPRLRMNYNLHEGPESKAQRLLNALEPGTVLPIHRHRHTDETYILLRGKLKVLFYNDKKELQESFELDPATGNSGIHISAGQWHTVQVREPGTVIFEVKDGPYTPLAEEDIL